MISVTKDSNHIQINIYINIIKLKDKVTLVMIPYFSKLHKNVLVEVIQCLVRNDKWIKKHTLHHSYNISRFRVLIIF